MAKNVDVNINGKAYPCRMTMGAMRRFKQITGKDVTKLQDDVDDMTTLLYCCIASACNADKVEFGISLDDFADSISPADIAVWQAAMAEPTAEGGAAKKKP